MFQNCVFKVSVSTREWAKKAGIRAVKTMAQTVVSLIAVGSTIRNSRLESCFFISSCSRCDQSAYVGSWHSRGGR